jgi:transcriptional regulator with XRE-family HTH domain
VSYDPNRIVALRELRHWSQRDLADAAGLPQSRISEFESGTKPTRVEHVEALATTLDCTVGFLLGLEYKRVRSDQIRSIATEMAYTVFCDRDATTELQRKRCRRVLGHAAAPVTADAWTALAEQIDRAVSPERGDRKLRVVND